MASALFSSFSMRDLVLQNRIVVSPMGQCSAENGHANDWHLMHLGNMSISGAGLVIIEATAVHPDGRNSPGDLGLWSDAHAESLQRSIRFCRKHGNGRLGIQLWHAGRKGSVTVSWERQKPIPRENGGWQVSSASEIPYPGRWMPLALTREGITEIVTAHVAAAKRADALGLDLVEIHAAHGYLLHNFLSPITNQRTDEYGGDLAGRMRFPLQVFKAVRDVWPERKPIGMRISSTDWIDDGWMLEDSVELARQLKKLGCDYITASSGGASPEQNLKVHAGYQVPFAERIRREAGIATMAVGLIIEPQQADEILASGRADLVCLAREMLYNPRWPWHAARALGEDTSYPPQYERADPEMRRGDFLKPKRD